VIYYYPKDIVVSFSSKQVGFGYDDIMCRVYGVNGTADAHYSGDIMVRARDDIYNGGKASQIYAEGVTNNVKAFYDSIAKGDFSNPTVAPSVRSNLTTILGRTAAYKGGEVTWETMLGANEKWTAELEGLKT
jgi:myo-inositol 2-dehydrogenase / D-chiro-inositol 1-dehydrogenase